MAGVELSPAYVEAVGWLTIAGSTLDHELRHLHDRAAPAAAGERPPRYVEELARRIRRAVTELEAEGSLPPSTVTLAREWTTATVALLGERNRVVHALWRRDVDDPERVTGTYRDEPLPTLEELEELTERIREHAEGRDAFALTWTVSLARTRMPRREG